MKINISPVRPPTAIDMTVFEDWLKAKEYLQARAARGAADRVAQILEGLPLPERLDDKDAAHRAIERLVDLGPRGARGRYLKAWAMFQRWAREQDVEIPSQW